MRSLNDKEKAALNEKIAAMESLVKTHKDIAEAYRNAVGERATANAADAERVRLLESLVSDFKEERQRLMKERDAARRGGRLLAAGAFVLGVLVAVFATKN